MLSYHIELFITSKSYAPRSARQRRILLTRFISTIGDKHPHDVSIHDVLAWWKSIETLSRASRAAHLSALTAFFEFLTKQGLIETNPMTVIRRPRITSAPPVVLSDAEVESVLAVLRTPLDRVIVLLMLGCGFRSSDVASLRIEDIDYGNRILRVTGKGDKTRLVPAPHPVLDVLEEYIGLRRHGLVIELGPARTLDRSDQVRCRAQAVLTVAGVKQHALDKRSPHVLRRTFATKLAESGVEVPVIQQFLGHDSIATTMSYIARSNMAEKVHLIDLGPLAELDAYRSPDAA